MNRGDKLDPSVDPKRRRIQSKPAFLFLHAQGTAGAGDAIEQKPPVSSPGFLHLHRDSLGKRLSRGRAHSSGLTAFRAARRLPLSEVANRRWRPSYAVGNRRGRPADLRQQRQAFPYRQPSPWALTPVRAHQALPERRRASAPRSPGRTSMPCAHQQPRGPGPSCSRAEGIRHARPSRKQARRRSRHRGPIQSNPSSSHSSLGTKTETRPYLQTFPATL
jgi:hypothetical protein